MNKKYSFKRTIMIPASIAVGLNNLLNLRNKNTTNKKRFVDFHILFDKKKQLKTSVIFLKYTQPKR